MPAADRQRSLKIKMNEKTRIKTIVLLLGDAALLYAALFLGLWIRYYPAPSSVIIQKHIIPFTVVFILWLVLFGAFGLYDARFMKNEKELLERLIRTIFWSVIATMIFFYALPIFTIEPRRNLFIIAVLAMTLIFAWRYLFNNILIQAKSSRIIFIGINPETINLIEYLAANPQIGHKPVGFVIYGQTPPLTVSLLPIFNVADLNNKIQEEKIDTIVITREAKEDTTIVQALFRAIPLGISVMEFPTFYSMLTGKIPLSLIEEAWFLENLIGSSKPRYEFAKRIIDIFLALVIGGITILLLPFIASGIILSTPSDIRNYKKRRARYGDGIIFFRQHRVGKNGVTFSFLKFRSQRLGAEKIERDGVGMKEISGDPRQYPFGKFLRAAYLDELPQVWNVLKGEMSFIGPRPERPEYVAELKQKVPFYEMRLLVPPGITGWAQINMENDASVEDAPEKMQYDLYYIKNRSMRLDLSIAIKTIAILLRRTGR